jgi:acyl-coenzyme A thioesterase PaaI-like protein
MDLKSSLSSVIRTAPSDPSGPKRIIRLDGLPSGALRSCRRGAMNGGGGRTDGGGDDKAEEAAGRGADKARIARQFIEAIPFSKALGMRLDEIGDGVAVISMPYNPALVGDPQTGVIHGGAVSALMDTCGGAAVMSHPEALAATATIDLGSTTCGPPNPGRPDHGAGALLSRHPLGRLRPGRGLGRRCGAARWPRPPAPSP